MTPVLSKTLNATKSIATLAKEPIKRLFCERCLVADGIILVVLLCLFGALYLQVLDIHVWRHDALVMFSDYMGKLRAEGRWLNYIFFPFLKRMPPHGSIFLCLVCWGYFSYTVAKRYTSDIRLQWMYVLLSFQLPAFYSIIGWPSTVLSAFVILALGAYLADRMRPAGVFLIMGILLFGSFNNFYNLILLLYIKDFAQGNRAKIIRLFAWWIACYLFGFFIMLVLTKLIGGHWGLAIDGWRHSRKVRSLNDLVINLNTVWHSLKDNVTLVGKKVSLVLLGVCVLLSLAERFGKSSQCRHTGYAVLAVVAVLLAGYAQSVPYGLFVVSRTAVGLYAAVFTLVLILLCRYRNLGILFVLWIAFFTYLKNSDSIGFYTGVTNTWRDSIISMNVPPAATNVVHICSPSSDVASSESMIVNNLGLVNYHQEGFGVNWRQFSVLNSIGYRHYDCDVDACAKYANLPRKETMIHTWLYADKQLFLWYKTR